MNLVPILKLFSIVLRIEDRDHFKVVYEQLIPDDPQQLNEIFQVPDRLKTSRELQDLTDSQRMYIGFLLSYYLSAIGSTDQDSCVEVLDLLRINSYEFFQLVLEYISQHRILGSTPEAALSLLVEVPDDLEAHITSFIAGAKKSGVLVKKVTLIELNPHEYQHPADAQAFHYLYLMPGLKKVIKIANEKGLEKYYHTIWSNSYLRVSSDNFKPLNKSFHQAADILALDSIPELYIQLGLLNGRSYGIKNYMITISSGSIALLNPDELMFVLGHEIGHCQLGHTGLLTLLDSLSVLRDILPTVAKHAMADVFLAIEMAGYAWMRKAELSADRAGLLCCQNPDAAMSMLAKLSGMPINYYEKLDPSQLLLQDSENIEMGTDTNSSAFQMLASLGANHPWTVMRARYLKEWIDSGEYENVLHRTSEARNYAKDLEKIISDIQERQSKVAATAADIGSDLTKQVSSLQSDLTKAAPSVVENAIDQKEKVAGSVKSALGSLGFGKKK